MGSCSFLPQTEQSSESLDACRASRALRADTEAFEAFVHCYERQILNYLWRMIGDEQSAYDLSQETFLRVWQHFTKIRDYEHPRAWLFHVVTNLALSYHRHHCTEAVVVTVLDDDEKDVENDPIDQFGESDLVHHLLQQLSPNRRAALILRVIYGLGANEIGNVLGVSEGAARMTLSRGREQIRRLYVQASQP